MPLFGKEEDKRVMNNLLFITFLSDTNIEATILMATSGAGGAWARRRRDLSPSLRSLCKLLIFFSFFLLSFISIKPSLLLPFFKVSQIRDREWSWLPASPLPLHLLTRLLSEPVTEESLISKRWSYVKSETGLSILSRSTDLRTLAILVEQLSHRCPQTSPTSPRSLKQKGSNQATKQLSVKLRLVRSGTLPEPMKKMTAEGFDLILLLISPCGLGPRFQKQQVGPTRTLSKPIKYVGPIVSTNRPRSVLSNPFPSPLLLLSRSVDANNVISLSELVNLPWTMVVWFSPQWRRVSLRESSRHSSDEQYLLKTFYFSSLHLLCRWKKRLSRIGALDSHLPAYTFNACNLQQINSAPIQLSQARYIQFRTWTPNLSKILQCFRQVYDPCLTPRTQLLPDLEGLRSANLPSMESLLMQPSSSMERPICNLPSFMEKTVSPLSPVFQMRNCPLILTFLLSCEEEVMCLMPVRIEVLDTSSKSKCQSTKTIHHRLDLLVDVVSTNHLLACGYVAYRSCLRVVDLPSKYFINLSYALINALNLVALSLDWDKLLNFVFALII